MRRADTEHLCMHGKVSCIKNDLLLWSILHVAETSWENMSPSAHPDAQHTWCQKDSREGHACLLVWSVPLSLHFPEENWYGRGEGAGWPWKLPRDAGKLQPRLLLKLQVLTGLLIHRA